MHMNNLAKTILLIILIMLIVIIFFALTGINASEPEQAMYILIDKLGQLNRSINRMVNNLIFSIRTSIQERFSR